MSAPVPDVSGRDISPAARSFRHAGMVARLRQERDAAEARVRFLRSEYAHAAERADTAEARARRLEAELAEARHAIRHLTWSEE